MKKGTWYYPILNKKCPRCHEGELYPYSAVEVSNAFTMHERCPKCNLKYEREPGFWYGAMFVSYILSGFYMLSVFAIAFFLFDLNIRNSMIVVILVGALSFTFMFRIARSIWLGALVRYDSNKAKEAQMREG